MTTVNTGEPASLEELRAEFPDWVIDKGLSGRYYAHRPADSPVLSGDDLLDTRDRILGWIRRHAWNERTTAGGSGRWPVPGARPRPRPPAILSAAPITFCATPVRATPP
jgi:hypothetical protein